MRQLIVIENPPQPQPPERAAVCCNKLPGGAGQCLLVRGFDSRINTRFFFQFPKHLSDGLSVHRIVLPRT